MKPNIHSICVLILTLSLNKSITAQAIIDLETGPVLTGYNDIRIPSDLGTLFSLKDDLKAKTRIFYRLRASYTVQSRHTISLLYAPLEIKSAGRVPHKISFNGVLFDADTELNSIYKFNSYRLTYRYHLITRTKIVLGVGFTAKIRDANIHLYSTKQTTERTSIGFVPIINFNLWWKINDPWGLILNGDALIAPQGRAEDIQLAVTYQYADHLSFRMGYRMLEGGTESNSAYGFVLFHYASVGFSYTLKKR
jgi:hypothetical protein|tara:strand:+ start:914 stop:1666 length:753 start_codon:yes stop_codon:yes gene_type:complete